MAGVQEENRRRIAVSLLSLGGVLILVGVVLWISHQTSLQDSLENAPRPVAGRTPVDKATQVKVIQHVLFILIVLIGILSISLYAFKVWSRRFRQSLFRRPAAPTPSDDVWALHRVPEELMPTDDELDPNGPPPKREG